MKKWLCWEVATIDLIAAAFVGFRVIMFYNIVDYCRRVHFLGSGCSSILSHCCFNN